MILRLYCYFLQLMIHIIWLSNHWLILIKRLRVLNGFLNRRNNFFFFIILLFWFMNSLRNLYLFLICTLNNLRTFKNLKYFSSLLFLLCLNRNIYILWLKFYIWLYKLLLCCLNINYIWIWMTCLSW